MAVLKQMINKLVYCVFTQIQLDKCGGPRATLPFTYQACCQIDGRSAMSWVHPNAATGEGWCGTSIY